MFARSILLCVLGLFLQPPGNDEKARKDLEAMQGAWNMHALEINGKSVSKIDTATLSIKKDDYRTTVKSKEQPGLRIKLDASKDPLWIDMIQTQADGSEKVLKGIYKIEKDTLTVCRGIAAEQERPTQFATWPDTNYFVVTWKRK